MVIFSISIAMDNTSLDTKATNDDITTINGKISDLNTSISKIQLQILNINNPDNWTSLYSSYPNSIIISVIEGTIGTGGPSGIYAYGELITFASRQLWGTLQIYAPDSRNDASIYIRSNINAAWSKVSISNAVAQK